MENLASSARRSQGCTLVGKGAAAAAPWDGADLLEDELANFAFVGANFESRTAVVNDFEGNFAAKAGVDGRSGKVDGHTESGLFASSFNACRQLAPNRQVDVFKRADQNEFARWNDDHAIFVWQ